MADQFFDTAAELGSEEEDEDFEGEPGQSRRPTNGANGVDDSSEDDEDDDDEDRLREEGAGFIADEDEEDEDISRKEKKRRKKRKDREEDEELDEDDLALIGLDVEPREPSQGKYKRLKRGHKERPNRSRGVDQIFSDDEEADEDIDDRRRLGLDEFADFIDQEFEDELEEDDDREVGQPGIANVTKGIQFTGLDEGAEEDYRAAFGDGTDYDWAIERQEQADEQEEGTGRELQLKDVFEPSQLEERMLTEEDNAIREKDVPERLQLARKPFPEVEVSDETRDARLDEEASWVTQLLWPKKDLDPYFQSPFRKAVRRVLEFLNVEDYEVPFIFNHRKDYLIHAPNDTQDDADDPAPRDVRPERLLNQNDLWEIFDLDLKFRAFVEKREALQKHYDNLRSVYTDVTDSVIEDLMDKAVTIEEIQELQDYLHFKYSGEMNEVRQETANGAQKRANNSRNFYDKLRGGKTVSFVHAIGISPDEFARKAEGTMLGGHLIEDQPVKPEELANQLAEPPELGITVLRSAKLLYTQELQANPRLRRYVRGNFYQDALIDCVRTGKGMRKITEDHPYYEFKYLRNQTFMDLNGRPDLFLKMLKAEEEGLISVKIRMGSWENLKRKLHNHIVSDNVSEVSEMWNALRKELLDSALEKLHTIIANGVKENLRARCEDELAIRARESYTNKLDQAPYKPRGSDLGAVPNVLCMSNGRGQRGDAIMWAYVESDGRVLENGKLVEFRLGNRDRGIPDGKDIEVFVEICNRRKPDVIGISGFSVETRRLRQDLDEIINQFDLKGPQYEDSNDNTERSDPLEVVLVNDEVARLYYNSARASHEFPKYPPLTRYCVALGRYLQNPLAEYASLGKDIVSLPFVQNQTLISQEKLLDHLENAMVDMVNLVGINLPDSYDDPYMSKLLPYVCGLGPRKADRLVKTIQANGDEILSRTDLIGISYQDSRDLKHAMGPKVFANCASFLWLPFDSSEEASDYLDNTRVHPEDYDLARKMVADSMNLDEEDIKAEIDEAGPSAVIRRMVREDQTDSIHDLDLEGYARDIEKNLGVRKRATLETIRAELSDPYEEIRQTFALMSSDEIFTMLTGETKESLDVGMVVPVQIKRTFPDHIDVRLECGVEGGVTEVEFPEGVGSGRQAPRDVFQPHQTVRAKIVYLNRKALTAQLTLREDLIRQPARLADRIPGDWDEQQEAEDKKAAEREKEVASGRPNRVVNHPLFFSFNSAQAEEYLGSKEPGEAVIRPSSKGFDHLAVTWKVSDNAFQHIDVLEMNKASEYSVGKQLRVGKQVYSDLDELIVNHVEAMARKVTEMMKDDRFQKGTKEETEIWLRTYCAANPSRFIYAFCSVPKRPGYFWLCYQAGRDGVKGEWPVKVIPNAFEMQKNVYPDMVALKNGFKMLFNAKTAVAGPAPGSRPPTTAIPRR